MLRLSPYARAEWFTIIAIGVILTIAVLWLGLWLWPVAVLILLLTMGLVLFFRDPERPVPTQKNIALAPADGTISSIHEIKRFPPFDGPATCVRIFLSVLDVHVNRCPMHGMVRSITRTPGQYLNAVNPRSAEVNESVLIEFVHPVKRHPVAAVRQVAGMLARTIHCAAQEGRTYQRGERIGIIKLGSTTELYLPHTLAPRGAGHPGGQSPRRAHRARQCHPPARRRRAIVITFSRVACDALSSRLVRPETRRKRRG